MGCFMVERMMIKGDRNLAFGDGAVIRYCQSPNTAFTHIRLLTEGHMRS